MKTKLFISLLAFVLVLFAGAAFAQCDFDSIAAGVEHTVALKSDGTVWAWGYNSSGQLGDGTTTDSNTPVQVHGEGDIGFLTDIIAISAGYWHTVALKSDGTVWAWGHNYDGELGDNTTTDRHTPVQVHGEGDIGFLTDIIAISAGYWHTVALKSDGTVWAWGLNGYGQLGDGTTTDRHTPVQVHGEGDIGFIEDIIAIAAGGHHTVALKSDGTVWAWGWNYWGQLGDGTTTSRYTPVQVHGEGDIGFLTDIIAIAAGDAHTVALKSDGTVWAWGRNDHGQLGDNTITDRHTPVQVHGEGDIDFLTEIIAIAAGDAHTVALKSDGTVWAWGYNGNGQLGDNTTTGRHTPVQVHGEGDIGFLTDIIAISAGGYYTVALKSDGTVWAWGWNYWGQLGDGTNTDRHTPVEVECPGVTEYVIVSCGATTSDIDWLNVVLLLRDKYGAKVLTYLSTQTLDAVLDSLQSYQPKYICFVENPQVMQDYIGGGFLGYVGDIWRITREIDSDPYGDAIWGIITGRTPEEAQSLVSAPDTFRVRNILGNVNILDWVYEGDYLSSSTTERVWLHRNSEGTISDSSALLPDDMTSTYQGLLEADDVDMMITSGHANYYIWLMHYNPDDPDDIGTDGKFGSNRNDSLMIQDNSGIASYMITDNNKIYFAPGNCLIGKIDKDTLNNKGAMSLAWMSDGGAISFFGYTVTTEYGYMGWDMKRNFIDTQGQLTYAESFFLANQGLVYQKEHWTSSSDRSMTGLNHDLDSTVFYGDPALDIRVEAVRDSAYEVEWIITPAGGKAGSISIVGNITINDTFQTETPIVAMLPFYVSNVTYDSTNTYGFDVSDFFTVADIWHNGDAPLIPGSIRYFAFTADTSSEPLGITYPSEPQLSSKKPDAIKMLSYPNPFNSSLSITYDIANASDVSLEIYDVLGQKVVTLINKRKSAGKYTTTWTAPDDIPSGIYFVRLKAGDQTITKRAILIR